MPTVVVVVVVFEKQNFVQRIPVIQWEPSKSTWSMSNWAC